MEERFEHAAEQDQHADNAADDGRDRGRASDNVTEDGQDRGRASDAAAQQRKRDEGANGAPRGRLLTARAAIEYLGISLSTLNRIEQRGLLVPFRTPGGHRRYAQSMLDDYLEATRKLPDREGNSAERGG